MEPKLGPRIGVGRTAEVFSIGDGKVVKLYYPNFHEAAVQSEARAAEHVAKAGLPAPACYGLIEIDHRQGIIFERLDGETMLEAMLRKPYKLPLLTRQFAALHCQLHQCESTDFRPYRRYLADQIQRAPGLTDADKDRLVSYLNQLPSDRQVVCHGDLHPDNIMLTSRGPMMIDWMTASSGEAAADTARTLLLLTIGGPPETSTWQRAMTALARNFVSRSYQKHYYQNCDSTRLQVQAWLPIVAAARLAEGVKSEAEHLLALVKTATSP